MLSRTLKQQGFTAIELMVTLSVLAIMSALALPGFQTFMAENRARGKSIELMGALQTAQSEAKTRNRQVVFTFTNSPLPSASLTGSTTGKSWATASLSLATGGAHEVISVGGGQDTTADVAMTPDASAVCFLPDGSIKNNTTTGITGASCDVDSSNGTNFLVKPSRGDKAWQVSISPAGKISTCAGKLNETTFSCL